MQQHSEDLARGLLATGHEVTLLTARVPAGAEMTRLPGLRRVDWAVADAECPKYTTPEWEDALVATYAARAARGPFDVIHSQSVGARGLLNAGYGRDTPVVIQYHGNYHGYVKAQLRAGFGASPRWLGVAKGLKHIFDVGRAHYGQGHARAYAALDSIVVSRSQLRDTVRSQHLDPQRTHVIMNGVDVHTFHPGADEATRARWGIGADDVAIVTVGRLARDKGTDRAVRALSRLPERARLVIVGSGEEEVNLRALAKQVGVGGRVVFAGGLDQGRIPDAMRATDIFWFPTIRDEAAPLVMPQAMASGLPVVASTIGGIPEYVHHPGVEAVLIPPGDVDRLVATTLSLVADPERRSALGAAARRRAVESFSLEAMANRVVRVYREVIARGR